MNNCDINKILVGMVEYCIKNNINGKNLVVKLKYDDGRIWFMLSGPSDTYRESLFVIPYREYRESSFVTPQKLETIKEDLEKRLKTILYK